MSADHGLLAPGVNRAAGALDDAALVSVMLQVEVAWLRALAAVGAVDAEDVDAVETAADAWRVDLAALGAATEAAGNSVVPLVKGLRQAVGDERLARILHRGLTSQDVLDTALVLLARDALSRTREDLTASARALAALADRHRGTVMAGRTLTQHAVPVTFGLKAAQWLAGVLDAREQVDAVLAGLPVQCGGAAGTLALAGDLTADPLAAARAFADALGLAWPGVPWHTNRSAVTRIGAALVGACDALGVIGSDVALLSRPEIGEVHERAVPGRGSSSTMPHKRNPMLSVLIRSVALQAPLLGAQLHLAAAQAVDERPDGAWHSEWPALRRLLELTVTAASQTAELVAGLEIDIDVMSSRAKAAADDLLAERGRAGDPADYLGESSAFIDAVLARLPDGGPDHG
jgi:3-carboxy-cis,cis-muconate cycloisomerase